MKRAVILFGAGASIEYGAPSTLELTDTIERKVRADTEMQRTGGDVAYLEILAGLKGYLKNPGIVHFEHIYHCVHELIYTFQPTQGAVDSFRPLLLPFLNNTLKGSKDVLNALALKIIEVIYSEASGCCNTPVVNLTPLRDFIMQLRDNYITRIYTTNYDDFPFQADSTLYTGFDKAVMSPKPFDLNNFWHNENENSLFHLHGSVHMGFPRPSTAGADIGDLYWYDKRDEALRHAKIAGNDERRMDGTGFLRTSVITGLDKLSRLQRRPFSHFYSALARDAMLCNVIYVIGSGLADLHLNTWLHEARSRNPQIPILYVDYFPNGFEGESFEIDNKLIHLFHSLKIDITSVNRGYSKAGWTVSSDKTAAVWDKGFQQFLNAPDALKAVQQELGV